MKDKEMLKEQLSILLAFGKMFIDSRIKFIDGKMYIEMFSSEIGYNDFKHKMHMLNTDIIESNLEELTLMKEVQILKAQIYDAEQRINEIKKLEIK